MTTTSDAKPDDGVETDDQARHRPRVRRSADDTGQQANRVPLLGVSRRPRRRTSRRGSSRRPKQLGRGRRSGARRSGDRHRTRRDGFGVAFDRLPRLRNRRRGVGFGRRRHSERGRSGRRRGAHAGCRGVRDRMDQAGSARGHRHQPHLRRGDGRVPARRLRRRPARPRGRQPRRPAAHHGRPRRRTGDLVWLAIHRRRRAPTG